MPLDDLYSVYFTCVGYHKQEIVPTELHGIKELWCEKKIIYCDYVAV